MGDVADPEGLYRVVRKDACRDTEGDAPRLLSTAFNDTGQKPSVDRANMRTPEQSQKSASDGIVLLVTADVRALQIPQPEGPKNPVENYVVDVWARPLDDNKAHAQIEPTPDMTGSRFKKLKEALVILAMRHNWVIKPK